MSLQPIKQASTGGAPVFANVFEVAAGGFVIETTGLTADSIIPAGTPVAINELTRKATVSKTFIVQANAGNTATDIRVKKLHAGIVGDIIGATVGSKAYAITVIDKTNADYDTLTVGTTLGSALTAGDVLFEGSTEGATASAIKNTPSGLIQDDVKAAAGESLNVVIRGTAYERRIPGLNTTLKAAMKGILFTSSY